MSQMSSKEEVSFKKQEYEATSLQSSTPLSGEWERLQKDVDRWTFV